VLHCDVAGGPGNQSTPSSNSLCLQSCCSNSLCLQSCCSNSLCLQVAAATAYACRVAARPRAPAPSAAAAQLHRQGTAANRCILDSTSTQYQQTQQPNKDSCMTTKRKLSQHQQLLTCAPAPAVQTRQVPPTLQACPSAS
jgi:hypothetical protein